MATSEVEIYNLALSAVGTGSVSATTEASREAEICRLWFGTVRDHVLRAAPWPSAKAHARLAVLAERDDTLAWVDGDPDPGFMYAYAAPSDMLTPRHLTDYSRFTLSVHGDVKAIMTNTEDALLYYTRSQTNISLWDVQLQMAIVFALGAMIGMPLHGKPSRVKTAQDQANALILQAREGEANTDNNEIDTVPSWLVARGYAENAPATRYYFPYGPMISTTELPSVT